MLHYDTDALHSRILGMLELELGLAKQNREWHQHSCPMDIQGSKNHQSRVSALQDVFSKAETILDGAPGKSIVAHRLDLVREQEAPKVNDREHVWDLVIQDMKQRDADGAKKYGTHLQAFNGRNPLVDAYQEALDLVVYLRQAIEEQEASR